MHYRQSVEGYNRVLLIVVHVEDEAQAQRNVQIARNNGAHGAFLINHGIGFTTLLEIYQRVRARHPGWWIGLNLLDLDPVTAFQVVPTDVSGVWCDRGGIDLASADPEREARTIMQAREQSSYPGVHFGGVAFKYQPKTGDPAEEARLAVPYMDVLTTSGVGTGKQPSVHKIASMREAIGDKPLAIASGITADNVRSFLWHADCFLVWTGVSLNNSELDPEKVRALADIIRAW